MIGNDFSPIFVNDKIRKMNFKLLHINVMLLPMNDISLTFIPPIYIYVTLPNNEYIFFFTEKGIFLVRDFSDIIV